MNPWLLAGLVFGAIGLIVEAVQRKDDATEAEKAAATKAAATKKAAKKKAKPVSKVVVVEAHPQHETVVKSPSEKPVEVLPTKPADEVPSIIPTQE